MDPTTSREKEVLRRAGAAEGDRITIQDIRKVYTRENRQDRRAAKRMVKKGVLTTTHEPGVFEVLETPWDDGQQELTEGYLQ